MCTSNIPQSDIGIYFDLSLSPYMCVYGYAMLCYAMLCYVLLCSVMFCYVTVCYVM